MNLLYPIIALVVVLLLGAGVVGFLWYRWKRRQASLHEIETLSQEITFAMDERGLRHPQLIEHKMDAAMQKWEDGDYDEVERILDDVFRLVRLS